MIENGLLDKDTVIMACVKYMSEDDVADMMHINEMLMEPEVPDWDQWDSDEYDIESMKFDFENENFDESQADDYLKTSIVEASIINGQFDQARQQCAKFGIDYEEAKRKASVPGV
jgi:hypothetical protein